MALYLYWPTISIQLSTLAKSYDLKDIESILKETKALYFEDNGMLLRRTLNVPVLLVDKANRKVYSNKNSKKLKLHSYNDIYTSTLPDFIDVIKGPEKIGNQIWAVIPLPLLMDQIER